jgi:hypothetical protein
VNVTKKIQSRIRSITSDLRKLSIDELDHVQAVTTQLRLGLGKESHAVGRHVIQVVEDFAGEETTREWQPSAALLSQSEAS